MSKNVLANVVELFDVFVVAFVGSWSTERDEVKHTAEFDQLVFEQNVLEEARVETARRLQKQRQVSLGFEFFHLLSGQGARAGRRLTPSPATRTRRTPTLSNLRLKVVYLRLKHIVPELLFELFINHKVNITKNIDPISLYYQKPLRFKLTTLGLSDGRGPVDFGAESTTRRVQRSPSIPPSE